MMGGWMEVGAKMGIGVKLTTVTNANIRHHFPIDGIRP